MDISAHKHKVNLGQLLPLLLIGTGLIIIGLVAFNFLNTKDAGTDFSVVPASVSFPAPDITLDNLNGERVSLSDYRQQVILVNNWATWCPPCKLEMPTLLKYYQEHAKQGFMLIGIEAGDPLEDVASYVEENKLSFPILLDPNNKSLTAFHNDSLPSSYVINRDGTVVLAWTGPINRAMLEKYLTPLLEQ